MIHKFLTICIVTASFAASAQEKPQAESLQGGSENIFVGERIDPSGAMDVATLSKKMGSAKEMEATVVGTVVEVCQKKGCWMTLQNGDGNTMRVTFKDYAFFMPKDISGKKVMISGIAAMETTEVDELRHYAEDGGKSKEEIEKIVDPKHELTFEAKGVIIY